MKLKSCVSWCVGLLSVVGLQLSVLAQERPKPDRPAAAAPPGMRVLRDVEYGRAGEKGLLLDLYLPEKSDEARPLVIWVHGGAWAAGDKSGCPARKLVEHGYAVASINYRLTGEAIFPAQIEDCKAAVRWLRAHAAEHHILPDRFGVWGGSAGGHLVALLGTSGDVREFDRGENAEVSSRVQAVCDFFGPTDLLQMEAHALPGATLKHNDPTSPESRLVGGPIQENRDKATRANPITYISPDDPPFLIVHGDQDPHVPLHQSQLLFDALKQAGRSVHFHTIHGAGHGGPGFNAPEIDTLVRDFFDRHLKTASDSPPAPAAVTTESTAPATAVPAKPASRPEGERRVIPWAVILRSDRDHDGQISRDEFRGPAPLFDRLDRNRDGQLTEQEHNAAFAAQPKR